MLKRMPGLAAVLFCLMPSCTLNDALGDSSHPPNTNTMPTQAPLPIKPDQIRLPIEGRLPTLDAATAWLNSPPLTRASLRGKIVLAQFWTYSCINWRRTLPYVRAWSQKYAASGLVVIGIHTPEFDFEKDANNVRNFVRDANITFPIAIDSQRAVWGAFSNEYWPALYFIDAEGRIRHHQFGEGEYERSEAVIQELLGESGKNGAEQGLTSVDASGPELPAGWADLRSTENYLGYERTQNFLSPVGASVERARPLALNSWSVTGDWTIGADAVTLNRAHGRIAYRFHARDLHLVMGAAAPATTIRFRVYLNGNSPGEARGVDVDEQGNGTVSAPRMYQLIRQPQPIVDRDFEIEFLDAPVEAFSVTFG